MKATESPRGIVLTFRVSPQERRELALLTRAEQTNRSVLIRRLIREAADDAAAKTAAGGRAE